MAKVGGTERSLDEQAERFIDRCEDADPEEVTKLREMFIIFDKDLSGDLDTSEMSQLYEAIGKPKNVLEVKAEIKKYDENNSGTLDLYEFLQMNLGAAASPFMKRLLFFKRLEIQAAADAERAKSPRDAFLADRAKGKK